MPPRRLRAIGDAHVEETPGDIAKAIGGKRRCIPRSFEPARKFKSRPHATLCTAVCLPRYFETQHAIRSFAMPPGHVISSADAAKGVPREGEPVGIPLHPPPHTGQKETCGLRATKWLSQSLPSIVRARNNATDA